MDISEGLFVNNRRERCQLIYSLSSSHQGFKAPPRRRRHQFATTITESDFFSKTEDSNPKALKIKEAEDSPAYLKSTSKKERKKKGFFNLKNLYRSHFVVTD